MKTIWVDVTGEHITRADKARRDRLEAISSDETISHVTCGFCPVAQAVRELFAAEKACVTLEELEIRQGGKWQTVGRPSGPMVRFMKAWDERQHPGPQRFRVRAETLGAEAPESEEA